MNQEANEFRIKSTNDIINLLVQQGFTFFSSVYLHTEFNELAPHCRQDVPPEVWSDSLFFHIPNKALLLRVSLNYREYAHGLNVKRLGFHVLAEARPLEQLNELGLKNNLEFNTIPLDSAKWSSFGQPKIPYFVDLHIPPVFYVDQYGNHFSEAPDRWVRSMRGFQLSSVNHMETANALAQFLDPVLPYVAEGKILIPSHSGFTKDANFVQSEALMRERLNLRVLREIAEFGKFL